jgi:hypothetical protein
MKFITIRTHFMKAKILIIPHTVVFTSKTLPQQPISYKRNHQVALDNPSWIKQDVVATFLR